MDSAFGLANLPYGVFAPAGVLNFRQVLLYQPYRGAAYGTRSTRHASCTPTAAPPAHTGCCRSGGRSARC
ncbi:MAG TPA: hypothetical protein VIY52_31880 [Streptosporangiaceae bacterium]